MNEFDIKDVIDISSGATDLKYNPALENKLQYNILNGFRQELHEKESKELLSKLESPSD